MAASASRMGLRLLSRPWLAASAAAGCVVAYQTEAQGGLVQADAKSSGPLDPNEWRPLKLIEKTKVTHNSYWLKFELPGGQPVDLPVASCLLTKAAIKGPEDESPKVVVRPYTPVPPGPGASHLDLVVKAYPTGKMSKHLGELKVGESLDFKGPLMKYPYQPNTKAHIGMVAGGSGITPMLQVAEHILANPADKTKVSLIFANVSEDDILLKSRIDSLAKAHPEQFKVHYVVDKPKWGGIFWKGGVGYVNKDMVTAQLPQPGPDNLIMVCGPPGMMNALSGDKAPDKSQGPLSGLLQSMGYNESMVYKF